MVAVMSFEAWDIELERVHCFATYHQKITLCKVEKQALLPLYANTNKVAKNVNAVAPGE